MKLKKRLINLIPIKSIRHKLRDKARKENSLYIVSDTKCLLVCPHPDDEIIGAGGVLLQHPTNFDVCCISSSGVAYKNITAEERADIRIKEFNKIMDQAGVSNKWIFKTFGIPPFIEQINNFFNEYCKSLDTKKYDYIFCPHKYDNHPEHQYITNVLLKRILLKNGFKKKAKIVFYEVWEPIRNAQQYVDITNVIDKKCHLLDEYVSQNVWINYSHRVRGLNCYRGMLAKNVPYAEAFSIVSVQNYLKGRGE